ncbi:tyrosine-type recombinase/integrase [Ramlibacter tataouinensis]
MLYLNDVAWNIVQKQRDKHKEFAFVWRRERIKNLKLDPAMEYRRIETMNNTARQNARRAVGLQSVRIHDLRHTFGQRLRQAGVPKEDRTSLLGHAVEDMPEHYATATVEQPIKAANPCGRNARPNDPAAGGKRLGRKGHAESHARKMGLRPCET